MTRDLDATGTAGSPFAELAITRLHLQDIPDCIDIARRSFDYFNGDASAVENWFDARISNNPWQRALDGIGLGVRDRGHLIAFRAMFAQPWWIDGRSTVIAFAAHTCVEAGHRGCGLGGKMIAKSRDSSDLTGSTTAGNITQSVYTKLGFIAVGGEGNNFYRARASYVGSVQSRLGSALGQAVGPAFDVISIGRERRLGGYRDFRLENLASCSDEFDELWARAKSGYASCLERSSRYLNWRLFDFPTYPLSLVSLRDAKDRLRGYGIWHELRYSEHVSCAVLRDLFVANDDEEGRSAFMTLIMPYWRRMGITWVSLEVASDRLTRLFAAQGYEPIPSNGNRYYVYRPQALSRMTLDGWLRSGLDGDYFDTRPRGTSNEE